MFCKGCHQIHKETCGEDDHNGSVNLYFKKQTNTLTVLCTKHDSVCTHLCDDNPLLCRYCVNRDNDHKSHNKNTVIKDVELIKHALLESFQQKENINKFLNVTQEELHLSQVQFHEILKTRKEECMLQYANFLNKEEELLKEEYLIICEKHTTQYGDTALQYHEEKLTKLDVELVLQKEAILEMIHALENKSLKSEIVLLSETFNFMSEHPLGSFEVLLGENVVVSDVPVSTIKTNICEIKKKSNLLSSFQVMAGENHLVSNPPFSTITCVDAVKKKSSSTVTTAAKNLQSELQVVSENRELAMALSPPTKQAQAFFEIEIGNKSIGQLIFNLYEDVAPMTCRNFIGLCLHEKGYGYKGSKFHMVFPGQGCGGGGISTGKRTKFKGKCKSFFDEPFKCENYTKKHDRSGLLSMWNIGGGYHGSQFFITFNAMPQSDGHHVVFGDITNGSHRVLKKIEDTGSRFGISSKSITIVNCGVL